MINIIVYNMTYHNSCGKWCCP